jgi:DNA segregation ATPase FtsK/SpoIIIE, S-DNA-T family
MSVKTRPRRRRASSYRPPRREQEPRKPQRKRSRSSSSGGFSLPGLPDFLTQQSLPTLLIAAAAVIVLVAVFNGPIVSALEAVGRGTGVGWVLLLIAAALDVNSLMRRPDISLEFLRNAAGVHLLVVFGFGLLGCFDPTWSVGGVHFEDVTLGGHAGESLVAGPFPVMLWLASGVSGFSLIWPDRARQIWSWIAAGAVWVASLEIPQRTWHALSALFTMLMPRNDDRYDDEDYGNTYVPELDEEFDTPQIEAPVAEEEEVEEEEAEPAPKKPRTKVLVTSEQEEEKKERQPELPMGKPVGRGGWELPPVTNLAEAAEVEVRPLDNEARSRLIVDTLSSFGVDSRVVSISQGPTVTQFGVEPGWEVKTRTVQVKNELGKPVLDRDGRPVTHTEVVSKTRVRVNRITALANDLALALAAPTIRIEAPVPGKPIVGIEVPNTTTSLVSLRSVVESAAFQKVNAKSKLALALGKGVSGDSVAADLSKMPHLLIAGATGSGKSVCINSIIASFLLHNTPEELRLVLIDPKRVELTGYNRIPHLAFSQVIVDMDQVVGTLQAVIHEMDSRYRRFAEAGVRNIEAYNKSPLASHKLPYWVVIIDELADLMMVAAYEVERQICRLAQLARATGIHLVVATQRPSVDVITGLIKANFPTRIAFAVSSQVDSRTIIDQVGAEKLLGRGDMLFMATDAAKPKRIQGSYVSDEDVEKIVYWWSNDRFRHLAPEKLDHLLDEAKTEGEDGTAVEADPLYEAAKELALQHSRISTSLLQRRLHIGYPRAARLVDMLEDNGVVSSAEAGQSRQVLIERPDVDDEELLPDENDRPAVKYALSEDEDYEEEDEEDEEAEEPAEEEEEEEEEEIEDEYEDEEREEGDEAEDEEDDDGWTIVDDEDEGEEDKRYE